MLYISRILTTKSIAVFDTDDNSEDIVSMDDLNHCIRDLGMQIIGASILPSSKLRTLIFNPTPELLELVSEYGVVLSIDSDGTFLGFDLINDCVYYNAIDIVLSKYCSFLGGRCFEFDSNRKVMIKFIFDDIIRFSNRSFDFYCDRAFYSFERCSDEVARKLYYSLGTVMLVKQFSRQKEPCTILDNNIRFISYNLLISFDKYAHRELKDFIRYKYMYKIDSNCLDYMVSLCRVSILEFENKVLNEIEFKDDEFETLISLIGQKRYTKAINYLIDSCVKRCYPKGINFELTYAGIDITDVINWLVLTKGYDCFKLLPELCNKESYNNLVKKNKKLLFRG